ncbi:MAG: hypothetical protein R3F61_09670 [Myxococcota bacterium]
MMLLSILFGCSEPVRESNINPTRTEWDKSNRCEQKMYEHCYALRSSSDVLRKLNALREACDGNYLDSCQILFEAELSEGTLGMALAAARTGCRHGERELCREVLGFGQRFPEYARHADSYHDEYQAVLDALEAGRPLPPPAR